ncbi:uncharacterized protein ARMOST_16770 [Armillaria ostoyae]|uniref:Uncharacterized protein n=1 Tax=Armillaria ostoyae TaxID=47428 RepID=A0A284RX60_ARMOS|nr:uncharacterized protein ARMOST_16770 [Armillaria ostoyae]
MILYFPRLNKTQVVWAMGSSASVHHLSLTPPAPSTIGDVDKTGSVLFDRRMLTSVDFGRTNYDASPEKSREMLCRVPLWPLALRRGGHSIDVSGLVGSRSTPSLAIRLPSLGEWNSNYEARVRIDLDRREDQASDIASLILPFCDFGALVPHPPPTTGIA